MRLQKLLLIFLLSLVAAHSFAGVNEKVLIKEVKALIAKQDEINEQIETIKQLLGMSTVLDGIGLMDADENEDEDVQSLLKEAKALFQKKKYQEAKELYQDAWEKDPSSQVASYNLGISYAKMSRPVLAKKFLKQAVDAKGKIENKERILSYLRGEKEAKETEETIDEELKTKLTNLQKETDSLMRSPHLTGPKKVKSVISSLEKFKAQMEGKEGEFGEYYTYISDAYSAFEMYPEAVDALQMYEIAMKGEVLPDDFFSKKLNLEKKSSDHLKQMEILWEREVSEDVQYSLSKDIQELKVFASQMDEFVLDPSLEDPDFSMVCERLGEYPWGQKNNRHVLVLSRYQEIYYSSLEGTFPIDRYRDTKGNQFLKQIVQTPPSEMPLKEVKLLSLDLNVNGKIVPYVVLYTYIPKLESYVIVRINQDDLTA